MFEKEIDRLYSLIIDRTIGKAEKISVKEVLAAEIPKPIQILIRVDIENKLEEEIKTKFINSRFNFSHPEVISLQNQINSILVLNYIFIRDEYLETIQDSIHLIFNYLIRPQWTLINYIYDNTNQVSSEQIMKILRMFGAYDYLKTLLSKIIKEKNIKYLTNDEFKSLIWKCDREYIRRKDGYQIANLTSAIYEYINYGTRNINAPINIKGLIKFFEDKNLLSISNRLNIELKRDVNEISLDDLGIILEDLRQNSGAFEAEPLQNVESKNLKSDIQKTQASEDELKISIAIEQNDADKTTFEPLENLISDEDKKRFIKKIFKKNEKDYQDAIDEINKMKTWKEASKYIDEIYILNDVDLYSPEAIKFTDITYRRFYPNLEK
ncbi:MAG: hypothetical protein IGBAC_2044 [Ignavibacteriae bacterium]|nr:MAG: hypothetical protein IGBAC_2044 [Ignavibacteriota bacterium]